jgi:hypothetical protein
MLSLPWAFCKNQAERVNRTSRTAQSHRGTVGRSRFTVNRIPHSPSLPELAKTEVTKQRDEECEETGQEKGRANTTSSDTFPPLFPIGPAWP